MWLCVVCCVLCDSRSPVPLHEYEDLVLLLVQTYVQSYSTDAQTYHRRTVVPRYLDYQEVQCVMRHAELSSFEIIYFLFRFRVAVNLFLLCCREVKKGGIVCMPPFECASGGGGGKSLAFRENEGIPRCRLHLVPSATI